MFFGIALYMLFVDEHLKTILAPDLRGAFSALGALRQVLESTKSIRKDSERNSFRISSG
jgi:hypothetical protein